MSAGLILVGAFDAFLLFYLQIVKEVHIINTNEMRVET